MSPHKKQSTDAPEPSNGFASAAPALDEHKLALDLAQVRAQRAEARSRVGLDGSARVDPADGWLFLGAMIALGGGVYPCVATFIFLAWFVAGVAVGWLMGVPLRVDLPGLFDLFALLPAFVIGCFFAGFVSVWTLLLSKLFLATLGWRPGWDRLGVALGGLVGLVCTAWPIASGSAFFSFEMTSEFWAFLALGPGVATLVGQFFGALGGVRNLKEQELLDARHGRVNPPAAEARRVSIKQLLLITAWASVCLTAAKAAGLMTAGTLGLLCLAPPLQFLSGRLMLRLARRYDRWADARKARRRKRAVARPEAQAAAPRPND
ncbi:hypothetical protein Pla175_45560 [Pirellulimonas nuda]|uniref:Uncharacterized protein n=1 Tax=Pirellulimonas nuda TaxID=2528009 RepID=A0A518DI27_9BACT|nr:hypothetical protein [Pirellulimonas nuda]QDU91136.1 hypothetical protein Pla175_45560 [Pirellulimonas nuda]